jgi:squalene-associated FAD-dependent desaturase
MSTVHIIGAGLAGLSAAIELARSGYAVRIYEQAVRAGGRCRSFHDAALDRLIDNGNHLLLSGNSSAMRYLATIGATDRLVGPARARFPFVDVRDGRRWMIAVNRGPIPFWMWSAHRRAPGTTAADYLAGMRFLRAGPDETVKDVLAVSDRAMEFYWDPVIVGVLNASPDIAAASLMRPVMTEIFARGGNACRPRIAANGLSDTFIDPALDWLAARGVEIRYGARLAGLIHDGERVTTLSFTREQVDLGPSDKVVLAVPGPVAGDLLPGLVVPTAYSPIVNVHYRLAGPAPLSDDMPFIGVVGGIAQWIFTRGDVASVTVSAASGLAEEAADDIASAVWRNVATALKLASQKPVAWRVIKERRATFEQSPEQLPRRPKSRTQYRNLVLAGDWTATGLPATIEGAIRSGVFAATALQ